MKKKLRAVPIQANTHSTFSRNNFATHEILFDNLKYSEHKTLFKLSRSSVGTRNKLDFSVEELAVRVRLTRDSLRQVLTSLRKKNLIGKHTGTFYINPVIYPFDEYTKYLIDVWNELFQTTDFDLKEENNEKAN